MRVLITDDHILVREGLRSLLEAHGVDVVGLARNGREAIAMAHELRPDVVLMDIAMPEMGGLEATRRIAWELPGVKVVILTVSEEDTDLFEAVKSGAQGYVRKSVEPSKFFDLLEGVAHGELALTAEATRKLIREFARPRQESDARPPRALTAQEREVLKLLVRGITSNRELAERLVVSESTISYHLRNIMDKLHLQSRAQVVAYAFRHRLADLPPDQS